MKTLTYQQTKGTLLARAVAAGLITLSCLMPAHAQDAYAATKRLAAMGIVPEPERLVQFAAQGDATVVELLLQAGVPVQATESMRLVTALHNAASQGHIRLAATLIERGADVNAADRYGNTPLINAAYRGNLEMVKLLLQKGASINARSAAGVSALSAAVYSGQGGLVNFLLARNPQAELVEAAREVACVSGRNISSLAAYKAPAEAARSAQ
jgi:ankyrin repeat protein